MPLQYDNKGRLWLGGHGICIASIYLYDVVCSEVCTYIVGCLVPTNVRLQKSPHVHLTFQVIQSNTIYMYMDNMMYVVLIQHSSLLTF